MLTSSKLPQKYTVIINRRPPYEFDFITALEFAIKYNAWHLAPADGFNTVVHQSLFTEEERLILLTDGKGGPLPSDGWQPFCLECPTLAKMQTRPYGFECMACGNLIGWSLQRLNESPLNKTEECNRFSLA